MADEKLHLDKIGDEEIYLKKVDELGKTLLKEEHLKDGDIEAYLKKVAQEEKSHLYEPKIIDAESHIESAEEKALEAWKAGHKDIFIAGEELDDKLKKEAVFHKEEGMSIGMNDELIKKIKAFDKDLAFEHEELLHTLAGKDEMVAEGSTAYEKAKEQAHKDAHIHLSEEEIKKYIDEALAYGAKEKSFSTDLLFGKGLTEEKMHSINPKFETGIDKSLHGIIAEDSFKSKEAHGLDKAHGFDLEKAKFGSKIPVMEDAFKHSISHEIASEAEKGFKILDESLLKKETARGTDSLLHKGHEEELLKKEKALGTDSYLYKAFEDELMKKEAFGKDAFLQKAHEEELLKKEKSLGTDAFLHKTFEDELMKKEAAFGKDAFLHKAHEEDFLKEKGHVTEGFLHKAHDDEIMKKEKGYDSGILFHKAQEEDLLKKGRAFDSDAFLHKSHEDALKEKGFGIDAGLHKTYEDELIKKGKDYDSGILFHKAQEEDLLKKGRAFDADAFLYKSHEDALKEKGLGIDAGIHKTYEDELVKKEIAYGTDAHFHKDKDILSASEGHHSHTEKSHKTIHDLKAKFFELLRRVLRSRKCHLVTMRPGELLGIVNCVSKSKDPLLCEKFAMCEKKRPVRVIAASEKCQKEIIPGEVKTCTRYAPLYPSMEVPLKIFQCVAINVRELLPEEQKKMIEFEECVKIVKAESCGRFKFLSH